MSKIGAYHAMRAARLASMAPNERGRLAAYARKNGMQVIPRAPNEPAQVVYASRRGIRATPKVNAGAFVLPGSTGYAACAALAQAAAPAVVDAYERHLAALAFSVYRRWPVDTGLSQLSLDLQYEARDGLIVGEFASRAPYTAYIKSKAKNTGGKPTVAAPWSAYVKSVEASVVRQVVASAGEGVRFYARGVK